MIDLIIKPTNICNFACQFCSSSNISKNNTLLDLSYIKDYIIKHEVKTIIVNGGQPLMLSPEYYLELLNFIKNNNLHIDISFTSNLLDFYLNPNKWLPIFKQQNVGVITSFQYGTQRKLKSGKVYTEDFFKKVYEKFYNLIGYKLQFISVINHENEQYILKTVNLAKQLGTQCKLNPMLKSGRAKQSYPFYKMFANYLSIFQNKLDIYEFNCKLLKKAINNQKTCCPFNRNCYKTIRAINPQKKIHSCGSFNDITNQTNDLYELHKYSEDSIKKDNLVLSNKCFSCQLFNICNGCYRQIQILKQENNIQQHCTQMRLIYQKLKSYLF